MSTPQPLTSGEGGYTATSHQTIVIMEEDPVVTEAATSLFERHHTLSTLLRYQKGVLRRLKGSRSFSTKNHDVILVGHGSNGAHGPVRLAAYGPEKLARFVSTLKNDGIVGPLGSISLVSCLLGNERLFMLQLLQELRSVRVEAQLLVHDSFLSVSPDGEVMTRADGAWRSHDHRRRVIAELDHRGELLLKVALGCAGPVSPDYEWNVLYLQTPEWPNHPQMFVPMELRKRYPSIDCLEGLTWSLFFEENERRRAPNYNPDERLQKAIWLTEPEPEGNAVLKHINSIQDLLVEIRYNAKEEVASDLYYVLNDVIYKVQRTNLNVSLAGKFMNADNQADVESFRQDFNEQPGDFSLQQLRRGLKASNFNDFCRQTFQFQQCDYNCERWGRYFMAAVFSSSVCNFRTFSLFLMSVIGCEVGRSRGTDSPLCTAFVGPDHPMVTDQPWPQRLHRGFYGGTVDNYETAPQKRRVWLDQIVAKENNLYVQSKQLMNSVSRDEQTELRIFGRVKVMNKTTQLHEEPICSLRKFCCLVATDWIRVQKCLKETPSPSPTPIFRRMSPNTSSEGICQEHREKSEAFILKDGGHSYSVHVGQLLFKATPFLTDVHKLLQAHFTSTETSPSERTLSCLGKAVFTYCRTLLLIHSSII
ncbi:Multifunctional-autoprocessing repeats-in-toxin [Liparis tanakae]|uniref:Multifunctional-autoprocessing repeats-in-toxin n=1 Tax=Liparis tanakae TaxID=230148 RepID=A0A4Z2GNR7_9TELE|nr:Multifunctional-autoprocessing repeats-in-toxin [Liparis tanakae]